VPKFAGGLDCLFLFSRRRYNTMAYCYLR